MSHLLYYNNIRLRVCVFMVQVRLGQYRVLPRTRAQQRSVPVGHIRQFGDAQGVSDR